MPAPAGRAAPPGAKSRTRAAASSIASGRLSSLEQIASTVASGSMCRPTAQTVADLDRGCDSVRGSRNRGEERVALRVHFDSRVPAKTTANHLSVGGEQLRVRVAVLPEQPRRARDVGEEERHRAPRQLAHERSL